MDKGGQMIRFILTDIEGTTTDIAFVHKVLFPYSAERLAAFVAEHAQDSNVRAALALWIAAGIAVGIYSTGSVQAQKLLFQYSVAGDLTPYFSHYFDTNVGGKKESNSYRTIAQQLQLPAESILFLSDVEAELDAAAEAGLQVTQLVREGTIPSSKYPTAASFAEINPVAMANTAV